MCLILLALGVSRAYPVLVAANRDEFYARPSRRLAVWNEYGDIAGGRDEQGQGTWMAVSRRGRFAAVTNVRAPGVPRTGSRSRGGLVTGFLASDRRAVDYLAEVLAQRRDYGGFNLLLGDPGGWYVGGTLDVAPRRLRRGLYGLSNDRLDTPWPKVVRGRRALAHALAGGGDPVPGLLAALGDGQMAPDDQLPDTGIGLDRERLLSPPCIHSADYGTRVSTLLCMGADGTATLIERPRSLADGHDDVQLVWPLRRALATG